MLIRGAARAGELLVAADTLASIESPAELELRFTGEVRSKGKDPPVPVYVAGARAAAALGAPSA